MLFLRDLSQETKIKMAVFVAAMGCLVDVFDICLFGAYRTLSLKSLGLDDQEVTRFGILLLNTQLIGMVIGGFFWGVIGDKVGRVQVLFGSIILYSIANILNAFVGSVETYAYCRLFAGIGLAGEYGAALTLVSELLKKETRGIGTTIVTTASTSGAILAGLVAQFFTWQAGYIIGGCLGLLLLLLRVSVFESGLFEQVKNNSKIQKGNLAMIFYPKERLFRYISCLLSGLPMFFTFYVVIFLCPELGRGLGIQGDLNAPKAVMYYSIGMTIGDFICGIYSQIIKKRKKALFVFISLGFVFTGILISLYHVNVSTFYIFSSFAGFFMGYWAVYLTTATEQFGTNLRATVATTIPNLIRFSPLIMSSFLLYLKPYFGIVFSMQIIGVLAFTCSLFFISRLKETFGIDLNFIEKD